MSIACRPPAIVPKTWIALTASPAELTPGVPPPAGTCSRKATVRCTSAVFTETVVGFTIVPRFCPATFTAVSTDPAYVQLAAAAFALQLLTALTVFAVMRAPPSCWTSWILAVSAIALADAPLASLTAVSETAKRSTTARGAAFTGRTWFDGDASSVSGVGGTTSSPSDCTERP